jgi:hypothetical protein
MSIFLDSSSPRKTTTPREQSGNVPSTGFSRHQNRLIDSTKCEALVGQSRTFVHVRFHAVARVLVRRFPHDAIGIVRALLFRVQLGKPLKGIDRNNDITGTRVRLAVNVTLFHIVKNGSLCFKSFGADSEKAELEGFQIDDRMREIKAETEEDLQHKATLQ